MRYIVTLLFLVIVQIASAQSTHSRSISYIEMTESWVRIFDESGKRVETRSRSGFGDVVGYSSTFFIVRRGSFYVIYDPYCHQLNTLSASNIGEILSVSGNTFTAKNGSFISTYDKKGKKINVRTAN